MHCATFSLKLGSSGCGRKTAASAVFLALVNCRKRFGNKTLIDSAVNQE